MKKTLLLLLMAVFLLSGCSYNQFNATATGSGLGGMFGSAIGGIFGGPRGSDIGAVVGMVSGGVAGAATSAAIENKRAQQPQPIASDNTDGVYAQGGNSSHNGGVRYARLKNTNAAAANQWQNIEITNVQYADANDNHALDAGEEACITFEIHNRGNQMLYDVAPQIVCSNKHVTISPAAIISSIAPGQGIRYKAVLVAGRRVRRGQADFQIRFGGVKNYYTAKQFHINTL